MADRLADLLTAARRAQPAWAARSTSERCRVVGGVRRVLADRAETFGAMLLNAVPARHRAVEGLSGELLPLLSSASWLERCGARVLRERRVGWWRRPTWLTEHSAVIERRALGVVLVIAPGNYPLMLAGAQALQALAAGNAVLVKPAPGTVGLMRAFAEALRETGLPVGLFNVLDDTIESGRQAVASAVDHVVFTGSATTGRAILGELAERLTPATMELSGCDACVVLPDAEDNHLERAATAIAFGLTYNGSQTCIAPRRVLATPPHAARLVELLNERLAEAAPAVPLSPGVADRLRELIDHAVADGARLARGGAIDEQGRCAPTVLADVPPDTPLLASDTFAPWAAIVPCGDEAAMLAADARCPYRLGASIFGPVSSAKAMAARLTASSIAINDVIVPTADPRLPFGASGESGYGVTRGPEGLLAMTRPVVVATRRGGTPRHYAFDTPGLDRLLLAAIRLTHGRGGRFKALTDMVAAAIRLGKPDTTDRERDNAPPPDDPPVGP